MEDPYATAVFAYASKELQERIGRLLAILLKHPVPGVFEDNDTCMRGTELDLLPKDFSVRLLAADGQHRHRQFGLGELGKILGSLLKRNEIRPARSHPSGTRISCCVRHAIRFRDRSRFIGGEVVPEVFKVGPLPSAY